MKSAQDYLKSIHLYNKQFLKAFVDSYESGLDTLGTEISDVLIVGMGGSSFGGRVALSVFEPFKLLAPVRLISDYYLPAYADEKSLVILSSYSGSTEEVLSVKDQALERGCQTLAVTSSGELKKAIESNVLPGYIFDPKYNPSGSPRTAIGYNVGAVLGLLARMKLLSFTVEDAEEISSHISEFTRSLEKINLVKEIASQVKDKVPVFFGAEHTFEGAYIWRNFMNETAKHTGFVLRIPDLDHHFLDGLKNPEKFRNDAVIVYIQSPIYNGRITKRFEITKKITHANGYSDITVNLGGEGRLHDLWEVVILGSLVSYELSQIYGVNPATNDEVDFLKKELKS